MGILETIQLFTNHLNLIKILDIIAMYKKNLTKK